MSELIQLRDILQERLKTSTELRKQAIKSNKNIEFWTGEVTCLIDIINYLDYAIEKGGD